MANNNNLIPFKKGDPRINRGGRPRNFDLIHEIAARLCAEPADIEDNPEGITQVEAIMREWLTSKNYHKQLAVIQYAFGKIPEQIEIQKKEPNKVIIEWGDDPGEFYEEDIEEERRRLRLPEPLDDPEDEYEDEYEDENDEIIDL
jgi:hypothetical protein